MAFTRTAADPRGGRRGAAVVGEGLPAGHLVRQLLTEHGAILVQAERLEGLTSRPAASEEDLRARLHEVQAVATQLLGMERHHLREEQVLFKALERVGLASHPQRLRHEHVALRRLHRVISEAAGEMRARGLGPWVLDRWEELRGTAEVMVARIRLHIHHEEEVLFPLALRAIPDDEQWQTLARRSSAIGSGCHGFSAARRDS